jgi:hypothetical protein
MCPHTITEDRYMIYRISPLFCRPWTLLGISPRLIESHYENNYGAALSRLNAVARELETLDIRTSRRQRRGRWIVRTWCPKLRGSLRVRRS